MFSFCDQVARPEEVAASKSLVSTSLSFSHFRQQPATIITSVITCVYMLYCNLAAQQLIYNNSKSLVAGCCEYIRCVLDARVNAA